MLTHAEINERFLALDRHPVLLDATLDGWLAWPIIKERLWLLCLDQGTGQTDTSRPKREALARLSSGLAQIAIHLAAPRQATTALLYEPRLVELPDGRSVHPHLGDLMLLERKAPWLQYQFAWGRSGDRRTRRGTVQDYGVGAIAAAAATLARRAPAIRLLVNRLVEAIAPTLPEILRETIARTAQDQLGRFRTRMMLARLLFSRCGVERVVALDPDGKVPEIAAAKSLGLPVTEVQHGMFSAREPDYSWTAEHRALPHRLPLPDRVVVFGPLWSKQLRRAGYWRDDEIVEAQSPVLSAYRDLRRGRPSRDHDAPLRLLFPSQHYVRDAAIPFWREALTLQEHKGRYDFHLRIKVHPLEQDQAGPYAALMEAFPDRCHLVPPGREAFPEMLEADCVVGYTSLMLLEAIGLGIPAIGLRGGGAREGFCATFDVPDLAEVIVDCEQPEAFVDLIASLREPERFHNLQRVTMDGARRVYSLDGPAIESVIDHG